MKLHKLNSKASYCWFSLCTIILWIIAQPAISFDPPQVKATWVVDEAKIFDEATKNQLSNISKDLFSVTGDVLVVATLENLRGTSIEDYGYQLGRYWALGQKDKNNGVILIIALKERRIRIEVGYGLEGVLTDAICTKIINDMVNNYINKGNFEKGIIAGAQEIKEVLIPAKGDTTQPNPELQNYIKENFHTLIYIFILSATAAFTYSYHYFYITYAKGKPTYIIFLMQLWMIPLSIFLILPRIFQVLILFAPTKFGKGRGGGSFGGGGASGRF